MRNLITISDAGLDPDDVAAVLLLAEAYKRKMINLLGFVGNLYPAVKRAALIKEVLKASGLPRIPVAAGTDCDQNREVRDYEFSLGLADEEELRSPDLMIDLLRASEDKSVTLLLISGLTDACNLIESHPELVRSKVCEIYVMGGATFNNGILKLDETASNNKFDLNSAIGFHAKALQLEIPLRILTRFAAYDCFVDTEFYNGLAVKNKVGRYLFEIQKSSIDGLWQYANSNPSTERQNRNWFCKTFCKQDDIPVSADASPWSYIQGFSLYDPVTVTWILYPELFSPENCNIDGVVHSIVGLSQVESGVTDPSQVINLIKELIYAAT